MSDKPLTHYIAYVFVCLFGLWLASPTYGARSVTVVNKAGENITGSLERISENDLLLKVQTVQLKFSLSAIREIHFTPDEPLSPPTSDVPYLTTADGQTRPFKQLVKTTSEGIVVQQNSGRTTVPFGSIRSIFLGKSGESTSLVYRQNNGDSRRIRVRRGPPMIIQTSRSTWSVRKNSGGYSCLQKQATANETNKLDQIHLWEFPPDEGDVWPIQSNDDSIGVGRWLVKDSSDTDATHYPFELKFSQENTYNLPKKITGVFNSRTLVPERFTIHSKPNRTWQLGHRNANQSLGPCVMMTFLM